MKPVRILAIALLGYAAMLVPTISQARSVEVSLPGISVRLPAPPIPILVPPGISVREVGYDHYRGPEYGPGYYHEDWRHREDWRRDHFDHRDHDRDGWHR